MADDDRRIVPQEEAVARLKVTSDNDDKFVHTFVQAGPVLLGADWSLDHVIEVIEEFGVEESGQAATAMGHSLVVLRDKGPLFLEANAK